MTTTSDRSDIVGFRDGSPIRSHPESTPVALNRRMTKTEAKKHLADAKRAITRAQGVMKPTPQWILDQIDAQPLSEAEVKARVAQEVLAAEESLVALRRYIATSKTCSCGHPWEQHGFINGCLYEDINGKRLCSCTEQPGG